MRGLFFCLIASMKKLIAGIIILIAAYLAYVIFMPVTGSETEKYLYIRTGTTFPELKRQLSEKDILPSEFIFSFISKRAGYNIVKPGRYKISPRMNMLNFIRMLKSGRQEPVKLIITKLRTKEDLAGRIGKNFETDSSSFLKYILSNDSLSAFGVDTNTFMTLVIPDTYLVNWNSSPQKIISKLAAAQNSFWNEERLKKAQKLKLSPEEVYKIASIVEEETNKEPDKQLIASVYTNRLRKNMRLEADPTVKYALRDFGIKRVLYGHLQYLSPYNTYRNTGLPPGPICTPSINTIDAVLNQPETKFIFFVAKPDFSGHSNFAENYEQHKINARLYQKALDSLILKKQERDIQP